MLPAPPPSPEYAHSALEHVDALGDLRSICATCREAYPCRAQRIDASNAARELAAYMARYFPPRDTRDWAHAAAIAATVAA